MGVFERPLDNRRLRMRRSEDASPARFHRSKRRHRLAQVVRGGLGVPDDGVCIKPAHLKKEYTLRLPLRVLGARLDRDRDGLLVFFVGVVLLRVAAAVYFLTHLLVAAAPVVMLASFVAVSQLTSNAPRRVVGQWFGAGGASCEDHFCLDGALRGRASRVWEWWLSSVFT